MLRCWGAELSNDTNDNNRSSCTRNLMIHLGNTGSSRRAAPHTKIHDAPNKEDSEGMRGMSV